MQEPFLSNRRFPKRPRPRKYPTWGDEILDFYQPDEALKLEDLVPDIGAATPERQVENEELRRLVANVLREMPGEWRQALVLHDLQNRPPADIAKETGKPESEVDRIVSSAREYLRQRLASSGFHIQEPHERAA